MGDGCAGNRICLCTRAVNVSKLFYPANFLPQPDVEPVVRHRAMPSVELCVSLDGVVDLDVRSDGDTVWLSQAQMADLFGVDRNTIGEHLGNLHREGEAVREATTRDFRVV